MTLVYSGLARRAWFGSPNVSATLIQGWVKELVLYQALGRTDSMYIAWSKCSHVPQKLYKTLVLVFLDLSQLFLSKKVIKTQGNNELSSVNHFFIKSLHLSGHTWSFPLTVWNLEEFYGLGASFGLSFPCLCDRDNLSYFNECVESKKCIQFPFKTPLCPSFLLIVCIHVMVKIVVEPSMHMGLNLLFCYKNYALFLTNKQWQDISNKLSAFESVSCVAMAISKKRGDRIQVSNNKFHFVWIHCLFFTDLNGWRQIFGAHWTHLGWISSFLRQRILPKWTQLPGKLLTVSTSIYAFLIAASGQGCESNVGSVAYKTPKGCKEQWTPVNSNANPQKYFYFILFIQKTCRFTLVHITDVPNVLQCGT